MAKRNAKKKTRKNKRHDTLRRILAVALLTAGLLLLGTVGAHRYLYNRSITYAAPAPSATATPSVSPVPALPPVRIFIPEIMEVGLETQTYENGNWTVSGHAGSYLAQSAKPGESGNIIIYGHNRPGIFADLPKVTVGATIRLTLADQSTREYTVEATHEVDPSRTEFLQPTPTETLTVYTCSGFLDSKRFIVQALPVKR